MKPPKEYAKELVQSYRASLGFELVHGDFSVVLNQDRTAIQCALIAVDEMLNFTINNCCEHQNRKYFEQVKTEIINLK